MVKDVGLYNAVHEGPTDEAEFTVNGCSSAPSEVPSWVLIVGQGRISMLKICDCDCNTCEQRSSGDIEEELLTQPMVDPQIWQEIPHSQVCPAKALTDHDEKCGDSS